MIQIDLEKGLVNLKDNDSLKEYSLGSPEAFALLSKAWLRCGWDNKYVYGFSWLGRPIIQLPEDLIRIQELIYRLQPDVIVETGVAHGGSLIFYATLCKAMEKGRIIGVDIEIRPHNRKALDEHFLRPYITLIEGSSIDEKIVNQVKSLVQPHEKVLVLLDSCHTYDHVMNELKAYAPLVSRDSYIVVMDGIMEDLVGAPRTKEDWKHDNPKQAASDFVKLHQDFVMEEPRFPFNEGNIQQRVTYWPSGYLRCVRA
ncbi:MAG: class I SAM-dependent methyltransferase [Verrucomicrobia bacterium]|nr:class I SAM-dependent methyltransferase [Verrucomicrobiota bacterium]MBS0645405.1 class I SAM-dependent methyltransferase [Verrucomicrobiota bacterium]